MSFGNITSIIPMQYTHIITLSDDKEPDLWFDPILALQVNSVDGRDDCYPYFVTVGNNSVSPDTTIMLYDCIHEIVSYNFEVFKYSYDECFKRLARARLVKAGVK